MGEHKHVRHVFDLLARRYRQWRQHWRHARAIRMITACVMMGGLTACGQEHSDVRMDGYRFAPGTDTLVATYCKDGALCTIAFYDFGRGTLRVVANTSGRHWHIPSFSDDGKKIVLTIASPDRKDSQVALMNADGSGLRPITREPGRRLAAGLSADGQRVVYARWTGYENMFGNPSPHVDLFQADVRTGREEQLTGIGFARVDGPHYLPDGKNFVFAGFGKGVPTQRIFQLRGPFDGDAKDLKPVFKHAHSTADPALSRDGRTIVFTARSNELDGLEQETAYRDLFARVDGNVRRLTRLKSHVSTPAVSPDGRRVVFKAAIEWGKRPQVNASIYDLWLVNIDGTGLRKLPRPEKLIPEKLMPLEN